MDQNATTWPLPASKGRSGQLRVILAGVLVLGAVAYMVMASLPQGTVYYQTVRELLQKPSDGKPVRVAGSVAEGSIKRDAAVSRVTFDVQDGTDSMAVAYSGVVPDIFGPKIDVVIEGQRDASGVFQAQTLLAKCPSRFQNAVPTPGGAPRT